MEKFIKENWFKMSIVVMLFIIVLSAIYYFILSSNKANQQFNRDLVIEKQKCQDAFKKWETENTPPKGIGRVHFNSTLNTCLVDYNFKSFDNGHVSTIIDIYDGDRRLLELDDNLQSTVLISKGLILYENSQVVKTTNPAEEYYKRRAALFEEPVRNY